MSFRKGSIISFFILSISFADTLPTSIMLTSTGYIKKQKRIVGGDLGFIYYIGDIIRKEKKETTHLEPIKSFYFLLDIKTSPLKGLGIGGKGFIALKGSQPEGEHRMVGGGKIGEETKVFPLLYLTGSKNIRKNIASCGILYGKIENVFNPLIRNRDKEIKGENLAYFISLATRIFRDVKIEAIRPQGSDYILINTSIEKLLGFSFSFLKGNEISSIIGYFGVRLNIF